MPNFSFIIRRGNHSSDHKVDLPDARLAHKEATIFGDLARDVAAWRAGMGRIEAAKTVDMPLRLDNANALPTYPQQTQKQQQEAA